ncbi:hypothetical protein P7K49_015004 [Saguinus oedipus]|uniref:Uncharacterized protein n=1 Tax=Saguinus oedipus TaxID=9490 RepID=A0ABQ9V8H0_SAGOE|nr:hypothetical protein P7K49_015004 [Saguinus oedipus]
MQEVRAGALTACPHPAFLQEICPSPVSTPGEQQNDTAQTQKSLGSSCGVQPGPHATSDAHTGDHQPSLQGISKAAPARQDPHPAVSITARRSAVRSSQWPCMCSPIRWAKGAMISSLARDVAQTALPCPPGVAAAPAFCRGCSWPAKT